MGRRTATRSCARRTGSCCAASRSCCARSASVIISRATTGSMRRGLALLHALRRAVYQMYVIIAGGKQAATKATAPNAIRFQSGSPAGAIGSDTPVGLTITAASSRRRSAANHPVQSPNIREARQRRRAMTVSLSARGKCAPRCPAAKKPDTTMHCIRRDREVYLTCHRVRFGPAATCHAPSYP